VRAPAFLFLLSMFCALGCSSSDEQPQAREVTWQRPPSEPAEEAPDAPTLRPSKFNTGTKQARPPWKGERVRALQMDHEAAAEVERSRAQSEGNPRARAAQRRAKERRKRVLARARKRASRTINQLELAEAERRKRLEERAAELRTDHYVEVRVRVYLQHARARSASSHGASVLREAQTLAEAVRRRALACGELAREAAREADRTKRFAVAALEQGVPVPGLRADLRQALRQSTEIALIHAQAEAEVDYAQEAAQRADHAFNPFGAK
jgi:hypothetical protein